MGDIGAESAYFDRHGYSKQDIAEGVVVGFMLFCSLLLGANSLWTKWTFNSTYSGVINQEFFQVILFFELLSLQFFRTRSTIKYLPKLITITSVAFLFYVNSYVYACQQEALLLTFCLQMVFFSYFMLKYEVPA